MNNRRLSACLVLVTAGCAAPATDEQEQTAQSSEAITAGTTYKLTLPKVSGDSGNCVDVAGASIDNGANIQEWDCNGSVAQDFVAEAGTSPYYRFKNPNSGKCLNIYAGVIDANHPVSGNANGANIQQWTCGSGDNNYWELVSYNGYYQFKSKLATGDGIRRCLDVYGGATLPHNGDNGTNIQLYTCGTDAQAKGNQTVNPVTSTSTYSNQDVGAVGAVGSYSQSGGTFTVNGSGSDIWGTADEFQYVYQTISGDATITARVASQQNVNAWSKAAVMIRESLNANSADAFTALTPSNGVRFEYRSATGGTTADANQGQVGTGAAPYWVRLVRSGNNFSSYRSADGNSWTQVDSTASVPMASSVYIGLAVLSHVDGTLATATFDNVSISGGASCTPTTCSAQGKNCGSISDGCGGTLSCGSCTSPETCGGGGTANVCGGGSVGNFPARFSAPYVPTWNDTNLANLSSSTGNKFWTLAFIIPPSGGGCSPTWNGDTSLTGNNFGSYINGLRNAGGDVIVSFGGEAGGELGKACGSVSSLQAAYQQVIDQFNLTWLDLDIEAGLENDTTSIDRRNQALHNLQVANPGLRVDYTLAVDRTGLPSAQQNLLSNAKTRGVTVSAVNIMAMDYGPCYSDMGQAAVDAASATKNQLNNLGISAKVGVTPMIGVNDVTCENFRTTDATVLVNYAQANSYISLLAYWEQTADPNHYYINIFKTFH